MSRLEEAQIEAEAAIGAFEEHRESMDPTWPGDLAKERELYSAARRAQQRRMHLEWVAANFDAAADQAIVLTGGQR